MIEQRLHDAVHIRRFGINPKVRHACQLALVNRQAGISKLVENGIPAGGFS